MLAAGNLATFGHMMLRAVQLLRSDPQMLAQERSRARFILIDEFQDANLAQIEFSRLLAGDHANLFAVGDPDQAIYRFRGASSAAFEEFSRRFPQARTLVLAENQRSTSPILGCAFAAISANPDAHCRVDSRDFRRQPLVSARDQRSAEEGELPLAPAVELVSCPNDELEAADVAQAMSDLRRRPPSGSGQPRLGVLYRQHAHREHIVRELAERGIPFTVTGINALETAEVRDLLACLRVLASPGDTESLFRVAALPLFGLDAQQVREALAAAGKDNAAAFDTILVGIPGGEPVLNRVRAAREFARSVGFKIQPVLAHVLSRFEFDASSPAISAVQNFIRAWTEKPVAAGDLADFLDYMHFFPEAGGVIEVPLGADEDDINVVRLMSMHIAKGLEFDHVFVLRVSQGSFPTRYRERIFEFPDTLRRGLAAEGDGPEVHRQEERRLFYVGMTRARDSLTISARASRSKKDPRPLGFVRDLMEDHDARPCWRQRSPAPARVTIHAAALSTIGVGAWLLAPPSSRLRSVALSATAVEAYETCPLRFKLMRDWNIPGRVVAAMQFGNIIHTVLRDYFDAHLAGRPRTAGESLALFRQLLAAARFDDPVQRQLYDKQGTRQLAEFIALRSQAAPPQVIATERTFDIRIGGVLVKGRVDRLDRIAGTRVAIIDYKTGAVRDQKDADYSLQLSLYAIAARQKWDLEPERLVIYNLEDHSEVVTTRSPKDLEAACAQVLQAAEGIAAGRFDPTPGFHCRRCTYRDLCPATEQKLYTIAAAAVASN
jgi:superfamily I DNA/RNA helicase/RecB family exonuclease